MTTVNFSQLPILCYHKIENRFEWGINTVRPAIFHQQIKFLKEEGYQAITFQHILSRKIPEKPVIITFDDGYSSVYEEAFPVFNKFNFTAVIFIITSFIGLLNKWDVNLGKIYFRHLDREQIKELAVAGAELGIHGKMHRALTKVPEEEIKSELEECRRELQHITGQPVISLAYPFGLQNCQVQKIAREVGFRFGCGGTGKNRPSENLLNLKRIPVYRYDTLKTFRRKLSSGIPNKMELIKLHILSCPANLTPIYQRIFKKLST
jgi:peptidoglycan/xylan/chitin deacetylase (PgdA/CDA1 family)